MWRFLPEFCFRDKKLQSERSIEGAGAPINFAAVSKLEQLCALQDTSRFISSQRRQVGVGEKRFAGRKSVNHFRTPTVGLACLVMPTP